MFQLPDVPAFFCGLAVVHEVRNQRARSVSILPFEEQSRLEPNHYHLFVPLESVQHLHSPTRRSERQGQPAGPGNSNRV